MNCPVCNSSMTCLLLSWVCDTCNPPMGQSKKIEDDNSSYYYGWIPFLSGVSDEAIIDHINKNRMVPAYVFESRNFVEAASIKLNIRNPVFKRAISKNEISFNDIHNFIGVVKTYLVKKSDLDTKVTGYNIVSILFD